MNLQTALQLVVIIMGPILAVLAYRANPGQYQGMRWVRTIVIIGLSVFLGLPLFFYLLFTAIKVVAAR